jgi:hypothetical protein
VHSSNPPTGRRGILQHAGVSYITGGHGRLVQFTTTLKEVLMHLVMPFAVMIVQAAVYLFAIYWIVRLAIRHERARS